MKKYISPFLLFFGVVTFGVSVFVGYYVVPYKVRENVMEQSKIVMGNTRFQNWEVIPIPLFQHLYFFNVTNPNEVVQGGKPILQEIGPYVYQQKRRKFDIVFNDQNDTIFYREKADYFFRLDLSKGSESDRITFVNLPLVGTANKALKLDSFTRYVISETVAEHPEEQLYVNLEIGELTFKGKYLPFMKDLSELKGEEVLPDNTFGLYYKKNGTDQGRFEIYSGAKRPEKFGEVVTWNGKHELEWWNDQYCNRINGTDGGIFKPYATKDRIFQMFIPGLCRSFRFTFESEKEVEGIPTIKYSIAPSFFESAKTNPDNACYCEDPEKDFKNCPESGVTDLSNCGKVGMMLSQPHFYQGSDYYVNQSVGLHPEKARHEMALYIEPYTGVSAKVHVRFQMNVQLTPNKYFRPLKKIPRMVHPLFWVDQSVQVPEESLAVLREKLYGTINTANTLTHIGIIVGCVLIILSLLFFFLCSRDVAVEDKKIECVSYQPQRTFSAEKLSLAVNGVANGGPRYTKEPTKSYNPDECVQLLTQNGNLPQHTSQPQENQTSLFEAASPEPDDIIVVPASPIVVAIDGGNIPLPQVASTPQSQPEQAAAVLRDSIRTPDSCLSPFPTVTDYSSALSLADPISANALKDTIEAMSSYENL
ncbi:Lysosome membrane protein 2 [Orchesella cincta]|uniref:Lysosome membrane protein 2 n=1 Tax=Orchesella cincta TaxID=48709 RepID=A0A1D2NHR9_ORCCI|nr:Lysosome membrane protein 2 [Orchesella cincta]